MEEVIFPEVAGETQETMSRFVRQVHDRMHSDHPDLIERHLPILLDTNPYGRLYAATALHGIMDVIDARAKARAAREANLSTYDEVRKLA